MTLQNLFQILPRKIVTTTIATSLFAIIFGMFAANPFDQHFDSGWNYLNGMLTAIPVYLLFSFPVILVYGTITSLFSDYVASLLCKNNKYEMYTAGLFHIAFGLVLLSVSLLASILYFLTDRFLQKKSTHYSWSQAIKCLSIPFVVWLIFLGTNALINFIQNWTDYIVF